MVNWTWEVVAMAADAALVSFFYNVHKKISQSARMVNETPEFEVNQELVKNLKNAPDGVIPYACVSGVVEPVGPPLQSYYNHSEKGVIQKLTLTEHRTRRSQGFWYDNFRRLRDATNITPFKLTSGKSEDDASLIVYEPLAAMFLSEDLRTTYDHFEPNRTTAVERGIDRLFGDVSKGFQETEQMLTVGERLLGVGRLVMDGSRMKIIPPTDSRYILTKLTKEEVVEQLRSRSRVMRNLAIVFGLLGIAVFAYWSKKYIIKFYNDFKMQQALKEFRRQREEKGDEETSDETSCVICLTNRRDVILLDCGHICLCSTCADALPDPRCPMCRKDVVRILPVYMP